MGRKGRISIISEKSRVATRLRKAKVFPMVRYPAINSGMFSSRETEPTGSCHR